MTTFKDIPLSVLDLAVITEGGTPRDAFANSLDLAQHAENQSYYRYWMAEHHNMVSIASSATAVLIGHIAGGTHSMRIGSGGIMLPNHAPLAVAEQFGTLASLYPDRIDLGLGRAPGTDQKTARALQRDPNAAFRFPSAVKELQQYFSAENCHSDVRAIPGEGLDIPIWILGSSTDSAHLAASFGLPYAFASHFAPQQLLQALSIYKSNFVPSEQLKEPYCMACVNVIAADADEEAELLSTSLQKVFIGIVTNQRRPIQAPDPNFRLHPELQAVLNQFLKYSFIGSPKKIEKEIKSFLAETQLNEIMITSHIYDHEARKKSYTLLKDLQKDL